MEDKDDLDIVVERGAQPRHKQSFDIRKALLDWPVVPEMR